MKINLILVGKGIVSEEVKWIIDEINNEELYDDRINFLGFVDDDPLKKDILGNSDWLIKNKKVLEEKYSKIFLLCTIGNPKIRRIIYEKLRPHFNFTNLIHPNVKLHPSVKLGEGIIICSGGTITNNAIIEDDVYINFDVFIAHDSVIGKHSVFCPKTGIMGRVTIGEGNFFGANSTVIPNIKIGKNNIIGAGCVIIKDFSDNSTIVGVPGKVASRITP